MVSNIDPTVPRSPTAYTADMRANWQAAKDEIEELQNAASGQPLDYLPLTGGTISGPLVLPLGTATTPALEFGNDQTGFYVQGGFVILRVAGVVAWSWGVAGPVLAAPFNCNTYPLINVGNGTAPTDGLNVRTADARYAPVRLAADVKRLEGKLAAVERSLALMTERIATGNLGRVGTMPTELVGRR